MVSKDEFEKISKEIINSLPYDIRRNIENVEFIVMEEPTLRQKIQHKRGMLLGLYEGIPLSKRARHYSGVLPDRIYIFMKPIMYVSNIEKEEIREKIRKVILHEIGHYFGLSEDELKEKGML